MCVAIFSRLRQQPLAHARGQYSNFKGRNLIFVAFKKGNGISVVSRRLSDAIDQAFHAHGMLRRLEVSKFQHVQPQIMQQLNR